MHQKSGSAPEGPVEVRSFRSCLRILEREMARRLGAETSCCGISLPQCHCLMEMEQCCEKTVGDLAAAMDVDGSTMSRNLDGMAEASLIERAPNPHDRRSVIVRLAPAGRRVAAEINKRNDAFYGKLLRSMSAEERETVVHGIEVLASKMRELREKQGD